jgi:tetratricopeptide (TPR) repeat protein
MGTVFLAEQEQPVRRRVALKIIKAGMASAYVLARFEQERQALALMDHPHIAKVLDAGTTDTGRPYFVMELVKGVPITKYCDQQHLTPQERLELFVPVCQAVQHAHQKGIIHRDLKPSNVLVALYDGRPAPKVIDFGVAKAMGARLTEQTVFTEVGQIVGTLEYMAPEQAELSNLDIDTRADVYALGAILYELLTGSTPFSRQQLRGAAYTEMLRLIREVEPPRPSTKLSSSAELPNLAAQRKLEPRRLTRLVHGDLDWIVMKCLEKDRGRRYETANGLALDVQRYLADEPVLAGPPGAGYRLRKFLRRHRGPVLAAALVLLALLVGMVGTSWGLVEARRQRDAAEKNEQQAKASEAESKTVLKFFQDKVLAAGGLEGTEGGLGKEVTLRKAVDAAIPEIAAAFQDQPLVEASIRTVLGNTYKWLGEYELAIRNLERAQTLRQAKLGPEHPDTLTSRHGLADAYRGADKLDLALTLCQEVFKLRSLQLGPEHPETLDSMCLLACLYLDVGRTDQALPLFQQALDRAKAKLGPGHPSTIRLMLDTANAYHAAEREDQALQLMAETIKLSQANLGEKHIWTLCSKNNLAFFWALQGHYDQAEALFVEVLELERAAMGNGHFGTLQTMANLGEVYQKRGQLDKAEALLRECLAGRVKIQPNSFALASTQAPLGRVLAEQQKYAEAERLLLDGYQGLKANAANTPYWGKHYLPDTVGWLAELYDAWGQKDKADEWRKQLAQTKAAAKPPTKP